MEQKTKLEKEVIRLQLESLNCKLERLTDKQSFYESVLHFYSEEQKLLKALQEKQKKLYAVEHQLLLEVHRHSSRQTFIDIKKNFQVMEEDVKKKFQVMEEDLKQQEAWELELLKKMESVKKLLQKSEEELLVVQKEKEDF